MTWKPIPTDGNLNKDRRAVEDGVILVRRWMVGRKPHVALAHKTQHGWAGSPGGHPFAWFNEYAYIPRDTRATQLDLSAPSGMAQDWPLGRELKVGHDGFIGNIIGHYETRERKRGLVLQQLKTRVVHVYGVKWFLDSEQAR